MSLSTHENLTAMSDLLYLVSRELDETVRLKEVIGPVIKKVGEELGEVRLALSLYNSETGRLEMEETYGLTEAQRLRGTYRLGEGVTGKVFAEGQPKVVPDILENKEILHKVIAKNLHGYRNPSFLCVPVKLDGRVIGTLSAVLNGCHQDILQEALKFFAVIASLIARAVHLRQLDEDRQRLREQLKEKFKPENIIGHSKAMREVYAQIAQVSASDATVLLRGESGVGKELVAGAIHYHGPRANKPFIKVNCAALPESLLESELFGHEKGAFTGAIRQRIGRFEKAHGGTLFLDEIGDFSPAIQVSLLRAIQEREIQRVGGERSFKTDVRIIAATNRNLETLMQQNRFRQDLYYRLNVFPIVIPPLRERKEDINPLADFFVEKYATRHRKRVIRITTPVLNALLTYQWPGNVRELGNCIERAVLVCQNPYIQESDLPPSIQTASTSGTENVGTLKAILESKEKEIISEAVIAARGNLAEAARHLGISERIMGLRVKKYRLDWRAYRCRGN